MLVLFALTGPTPVNRMFEPVAPRYRRVPLVILAVPLYVAVSPSSVSRAIARPRTTPAFVESVKVDVTRACLSVERSTIRPVPKGLPRTVPSCTVDSAPGLAVRASSPDALSARDCGFAAQAPGAAATTQAASAAGAIRLRPLQADTLRGVVARLTLQRTLGAPNTGRQTEIDGPARTGGRGEPTA